jgi:hypothetical protein
MLGGDSVRATWTRGPAAVLVASALLLATIMSACGPTGAGSSATGVPSSQASAYPGWPGSGQAVGTGDLVPILVSSELAVGKNRFLFTLVDTQNRLLAAPNVEAGAAFFDLGKNPEFPVGHAEGRFIWSIEGERGLYAAPAEFSRAGEWGVEVTATQRGKPDRSARVVFSVQEKALTPAIGAAAPQSSTPTATDANGIAAISTDSKPDPEYYRRSIAEAVRSGRPTLIVFATPLFCRSQTCGPTLDTVKSVAIPYRAQMNLVHVEPYELRYENGQHAPVLDSSGQLQTVQALRDWGLPSEPYVFVVNRNGLVSAKFEGVVGKDELVAAIRAVLR